MSVVDVHIQSGSVFASSFQLILGLCNVNASVACTQGASLSKHIGVSAWSCQAKALHMACVAPGSGAGILAALTAAIAFTAIKFVPRSEPTVVLALWFHCSAVAIAVGPLLVRAGHALCLAEQGFCS